MSEHPKVVPNRELARQNRIRRRLRELNEEKKYDIPENAIDAYVALLRAAKNGDHRLVKRMLNLGWKVDTSDLQNNTLLMLASAGGHLETVKLLLAKGAYPHSVNKAGETALVLAIRAPSAMIVKELEPALKDMSLDAKTSAIEEVDKLPARNYRSTAQQIRGTLRFSIA